MSILSTAVNSAANSVNSAATTAATSAASQIGTTASNALSSLTGTTPSTTSTGSTSSTSPTGSQTIAGNFNTFLQLLTTQLQNQDPLSPLDTTQFTQQLVEFASVEQQVNMNSNLQTLIAMQQTSEATSALQLVGNTVTVNGNAAALSNATNSPATWSINASAPATGTVTITSSAGTTAYTGTVALNAGTQSYTWNGVGNSGQTWPDGTYTMTSARPAPTVRLSRRPRRCRASSPPSTSTRTRRRSRSVDKTCRSARSSRSATARSAVSAAASAISTPVSAA